MDSVNVQITIMNCLTDAEHLMRAYEHDKAAQVLTFVKMLVMKYATTDVQEDAAKIEALKSSFDNRVEKKVEEEPAP